MDDRSFDRLARLLGGASDRRTGLKALVGGILGAGGMAALAADADAKRKKKKKKKKCNPACDAGFDCVKGQCVCQTGIACEGACCGADQVCRDGACADPLPACLEFGAECKNVGRRCCDGLTCASGQGGSFPITCVKAKGAACASTAECPFGMSCTNGACRGNGGASVPTGAACSGGATCEQPGAVCTAYTTAGAPGGEFCTLPLRKVCTGNPDCSCYNCWYVQANVDVNGRQGREAAPRKACIQPAGGECASDADCARGLTCDQTTKKCVGTQCAPAGAPCPNGNECCQGIDCQSGTCGGGGGGGGGGGKQIGDTCTNADTCPTGSTCTASADPSKSGEGTKCLLNNGETSAVAANCKGNGVYDGKCVTCTVYYTTGDNSTSFTALKTALEAAAATPTDATKNPVYVGAGTYTFANPDQFEGALKLVSGQIASGTAVKILACGNGPVTFDGGSTVTIANDTTLPVGTEWSNSGQGLLYLTHKSPADYNNSAGYEIDGIDFQNGRNPKTGGQGGAIGTEVSLTLRNAKISRCKGPVGGIKHTGQVLDLKNVEISQSYGTDVTAAGGVYGLNLITLENIKVVYNSSDVDTTSTGGLHFKMNDTGESTTLKGTVQIQNNGFRGLYATGAGYVVDCSAVTSAAGAICGNPTSGATGETNCGGTATFTGCDNLCKGTPKGTTANGGQC